MPDRPNVLFLMTDQQRFDTIAALGNAHLHARTGPSRAARRDIHPRLLHLPGVRARPLHDPHRLRASDHALFSNGPRSPVAGQAESMEERCGAYLPQTMRDLGYRTFGIGKFHTQPWDEDLGYDVHLHSEELYGTPGPAASRRLRRVDRPKAPGL